MSERCFYKVEDSQSSLHKKCCEFLDMERELTERQKRAIEEKLPKFSKFKGVRGFTRIVRYEGFVFDDQEHIDAKVWKTEEQDGYMLSTPNRRTKAGREMDDFLANFKRTKCWDVDRLLDINKTSTHGSFYPANLFRHNGCIYIMIDSQFRDVFEQNNPDVAEITFGEINKAIDAYNHDLSTKKMNKYIIELTEKQLRLIARCVEDCHRFAAGQTGMTNTTSNLFVVGLRDKLAKLGDNIAHCDWAGNGAAEGWQRRFVAETYPIYREIYHHLAIESGKENVYTSPTLRSGLG